MKKKRKAHKKNPSREELQRELGPVWDAEQMQSEFVVTAIIGNEVVVRRRSDNQVGTLSYQNDPLLYYNFTQAPTLE